MPRYLQYVQYYFICCLIGQQSHGMEWLKQPLQPPTVSDCFQTINLNFISKYNFSYFWFYLETFLTLPAHNADLVRSWQNYADLARSSQISQDLHRSRQIFTDLSRSSQTSPDLHRSRQIFTDLARYSQISPDLHKQISAILICHLDMINFKLRYLHFSNKLKCSGLYVLTRESGPLLDKPSSCFDWLCDPNLDRNTTRVETDFVVNTRIDWLKSSMLWNKYTKSCRFYLLAARSTRVLGFAGL